MGKKKLLYNKETCWYRESEIIAEMNGNYQKYLDLMPTTRHIAALQKNIDAMRSLKSNFTLIDLGCGTAQACLYLDKKKIHYTGADLDFIIENCAKKWHPENNYIAFDAETTDYKFIKDFDIVLMNGYIDVMEYPMDQLAKVLKAAKKYVILHRQELSSTSSTHTIINASYGSKTYHSIINAEDFVKLYVNYGYYLANSENCGFNNWEGGGESLFLIKG